jgi:hypothetical protein
MGIKNTKFDTDFEYVEKIAKTACEESCERKSDGKPNFLLLLLSAKLFDLHLF